MEIQTFKILRLPEGSRITAQQLVELLRVNRPDTRWIVREICDVHDAKNKIYGARA